MKVLINRSDAIGDSILTSSMARAIKEKHPEAKVVFLISARTADIFEKHPFIDEVKIYNRKASLLRRLKQIFFYFSEVKPTHYFYVGGGNLPNFIAWLFRVPFRGGIKSRWHTYLFLNEGIRQKRSMVSMHEMEYNLNLLTPMGIKYSYLDKEKYAPVILLSDDEKQKHFESFKNNLEKNKIKNNLKMIFIHPGMTGHTLNWATKNYGRLVLDFEKKFPEKFLFVISYTPSDEPYLRGIREILEKVEYQYLQERIFFFDGSIHGLRHYMSVLSHASLFIGPSTGTTHIASVLGVPVVGLYSPIKVQSALRWSPLAQNMSKIKIVVPDVICGENKKCAGVTCPYYECMSKIEVEDVIARAQTIMDI